MQKKTQVILLCLGAAILYGVLHDEVTAHVCLEYFTIAHPPYFDTQSPALLGLCWGIAATIGIGGLLGYLLAAVSQSPGPGPYPVPRIAWMLAALFAAMGVSACAAGMAGYELARRGVLFLPFVFAQYIPEAQHARFMGVWFAHGASYLVGLGGGLLLIMRIWLRRGRPPVITVVPRTGRALARAAILTVLVSVILYIRFHG